MQFDVGMPQHLFPLRLSLLPEIAQQVHHYRRSMHGSTAKGHSAKYAHLLLELRGNAGIDRVMSAIMRTRSDLIHQQAPVREHKKLDAQYAAIIQLPGNANRNIAGISGDFGRYSGRNDADIED